MNIIKFQEGLEEALRQKFKTAKIFNQESSTQTNPPYHTTVELDGKQYHLNIYVLPDDVESGEHPELTTPATWVKNV